MRNLIRQILKEEIYSPMGSKHTTGRFVYHKSPPQVRDSVFKSGLLVSVGDCYKTYSENFSKEECVPAIFATDSENENYWFQSTWDDDVWEINTECSGVTWYKDKHYQGGFPITNYHIVTFEDISPDCITLIYKGTGEDN